MSMNYPNPRGAIQQYGQVGAQGAAFENSSHKLVQMLLDGALDKIAIARGHIERSDIAEKGRHISWAISIVNGLRASLDKSAGGEIAENLDRLYDYMERRLFEANVENDISKLDEVSSLLGEIKSAWDVITEQAQSSATQEQAKNPKGGVSAIG
jgi:flagellar protein FliS